METQSCCFIGHRKLQDKERVFSCVKKVVETLVAENGVRAFNFGSKSEFDDLCYLAVTELQGEYQDIVKVNYNRKSEYVVKKEEKLKLEKAWSCLLGEDISLKDFDESKMSDRVRNAGKASYVERNKEMIDDSFYCVFFYNNEYKPEVNTNYSSSGKSGTKLAYDYAVRKRKTIINIGDMI